MAAPHSWHTTYLAPTANSGANVKPTLLAFHGSGSNGMIHTVQLARLQKQLKDYFTIEALEAPFPSAAGPGILPFFEGCGPFKRWIPPSEKVSIDAMKRGEASAALPSEVESLVRDAVTKVRNEGGTVVGLIGFSQGTRVVAGLLKGVEIRRAVLAQSQAFDKTEADGLEWLDFHFALSICGSYPPPLIPPSASKLLTSSSLSPDEQTKLAESRIELPTLHVQGKTDEWAWAGKLLIEGAYAVQGGKNVLLECDHGHVYPVAVEDNERVRDWVLERLGETTKEKR